MSEFRSQTKDCEDITAEAIAANPRFLLLLRLNAGLSQTSFEQLLGMSKNIHKYETGAIRRMRRETAARFLAKIGRTAISEEAVIRNFRKFSKDSCGWFKANTLSEKASAARLLGAQTSLSKRASAQEEELANALKRAGYAVTNSF